MMPFAPFHLSLHCLYKSGGVSPLRCHPFDRSFSPWIKFPPSWALVRPLLPPYVDRSLIVVKSAFPPMSYFKIYSQAAPRGWLYSCVITMLSFLLAVSDI